ncbi:MAG: hypothetical protein P8I74_04320 [Phycisphaerales bacterium]|jgi:hypothetical protein|nr:hypothetical protein [Phycisphaerales bacterium]
MVDDDPTDDDLDRFAGETGYCPDCGAEIWDEAYQCPHCNEIVENRVSHSPTDRAGGVLSARSVVVLVIVIIAVLVLLQLR